MTNGTIPRIRLPIAPDNAQHVREVLRVGRGIVNQVLWSGDGEILVVASSLGVWLYDAREPQAQPRLLPYQHPVWDISLTRDAKTLAVGVGKMIRLWDMAAGRERAVLTGHAEHIRCLEFSSDGTLLASGSHDGTIRLWYTETGAERSVLVNDDDKIPITGVAFGPDGSKLVSSRAYGAIDVWDLKTDAQLGFFIESDRLTDVAFSPDGRTVASANADHRRICLWDIAAGELIRVLEHVIQILPGDELIGSMARGLAFSPDGTRLASNSSLTVNLFDVGSGEREMLLKATDSLRPDGYTGRVSFSPDGRRLAFGLDIWNVETGEKQTVLPDHAPAGDQVEFGLKGEIIAVGAGETYEVQLWHLATGVKERIPEERYLGRLSESARSITFSPDGTLLATWSKDFHLWDARTGEALRTFRADCHGFQVDDIAFSPDGKLLGAGSRSTIWVWDIESGEMLHTFQVPGFPIRKLAFHPEGILLATDGVGLSTWNTRTGQKAGFLRNGCEFFALSADGELLAAEVSHPHQLVVWNLETGKVLGALEEPIVQRDLYSSLVGLAFFPNEHRLAYASTYAILIWDPETNSKMTLVDENVAVPLNNIKAMAIHPNGTLLAMGYYGRGDIQLLDTRTGQQVAQLVGHTDSIADLKFSPDGTILTSTSKDRTIRLWGIPEG